MKKSNLTTLVMIGMSAGFLAGGCEKGKKGFFSSSEQLNVAVHPELKSFYDSLSNQEKEKFLQLDFQHQMMANEMVLQGCSGKNTCKGKGGCRTARHTCAGKNNCKGMGGLPVTDPNRAVEVQYQSFMLKQPPKSS